MNHEEAMALKIGDRFDRADGFEWEVVGTTNSHVVVKVVRGAVNVGVVHRVDRDALGCLSLRLMRRDPIWIDSTTMKRTDPPDALHLAAGDALPAREVGTDHPQKCDCCKSSAVVSTGADDLCADCAATYITRLRQMNADKNAKIERLENPLIDVRYDGDRVESVCVGGLLYVPAGDENTVGSPANLARSNERLKRYAKAAIDDEYESGVKYRAIIAELTAKLTEEKRISAGLQALYVEATEAKAPKVERGAGLLTSWAPGKTGRQ